MRAGPERKKNAACWDLSVSCAKGPAAGVLILGVLEGSQSVLHHQSVPSHGSVKRWDRDTK